MKCFHSQIHHTCRIAYFFRTFPENSLVCDVILVARQRVSFVCFCRYVNNGKERADAITNTV